MMHNKRLIDLSNSEVSHVKTILQLGERFELPLTKQNKKNTCLEFIKQVECNISGKQPFVSNKIRHDSISAINRFMQNIPAHQKKKIYQ